MTSSIQPNGAASRYSTLESDRNAALQKAREASALTIPELVPPSGYSSSSRLKTPYQSLGARAVQTLAAKILMSLLPTNIPFFRMGLDELTLVRLQEEGADQERIDEALAKIERAVQDRIEGSSLRAKLSEALKHLLTAGNVLLYVGAKVVRVYKIDSYVVKRDGVGNVLEIIAKEKVSPKTLSDKIRSACNIDVKKLDTDVELYTVIEREQESFVAWQEINGYEVPGSRGNYPIEACPWLALRFEAIDGDSWGNSYVYKYIGALRSLEGLTKAIVQGSAASAKVVYLVNSNGTTSRRKLAAAANGDFVDGSANDVSALQLNKFADFQVTQKMIEELTEQLSYAFLMNTAVQRNGERVTATEITYMIQELENGLGGNYSLLGKELQEQVVNVFMDIMSDEEVLPPLPTGVFKVGITTGLEALGRGQDAERLRMLLSDLSTLGPEALQAINMPTLVTRLAVARGVDTTNLIKSSEELQAEAEAAQMNQFMADAGTRIAPELVKGAIAQNQSAVQQ